MIGGPSHVMRAYLVRQLPNQQHRRRIIYSDHVLRTRAVARVKYKALVEQAIDSHARTTWKRTQQGGATMALYKLAAGGTTALQRVV